MKKILFLMTLLVMGVSFAFAQTNADIKFDKTTHDFGKFSENSPVVSCTFTFTNTRRRAGKPDAGVFGAAAL